MMNVRRTAAAAATLWLGCGILLAGYTIDWYTVDGGGGRSSGGGVELTGTVGQADASAPSALGGRMFVITGGFWALPAQACTAYVAPDFNHDCAVDALDFALFSACATGPDLPYQPVLPDGCQMLPDGTGHIAADLDRDGDVDTEDFAV